MSDVKLKMDVVVKENERWNKNPWQMKSKFERIKKITNTKLLSLSHTKDTLQMGGY